MGFGCIFDALPGLPFLYCEDLIFVNMDNGKVPETAASAVASFGDKDTTGESDCDGILGEMDKLISQLHLSRDNVVGATHDRLADLKSKLDAVLCGVRPRHPLASSEEPKPIRYSSQAAGAFSYPVRSDNGLVEQHVAPISASARQLTAANLNNDNNSRSDTEFYGDRDQLARTGAVPKHGLVWKLVPDHPSNYDIHKWDTPVQLEPSRQGPCRAAGCSSSGSRALDGGARRDEARRSQLEKVRLYDSEPEVGATGSKPVCVTVGTTASRGILRDCFTGTGSLPQLSFKAPGKPSSDVVAPKPQRQGVTAGNLEGFPSIYDDHSESESNMSDVVGAHRSSLRRAPMVKTAKVPNRDYANENLGDSDDDSPPRRRLGRRSSCATESSYSVGQLISALQRLDSRTVPPPDVYDVTLGRSFADFFEDFEQYCASKFVGGSHRWLSELGRYLSGDLHGVYCAVRGPDDTYEEVKAKLLRWFTESHLNRQTAVISRFREAHREPHESLYVYGVRLEKLFRLAYPRKSVERSRTLQRRYIETVPPDFGQQLHYSYGVVKLVGQTFGWSQVLQLALVRDNQHPDSARKVQPCYTVAAATLRSPVKDVSVQTEGSSDIVRGARSGTSSRPSGGHFAKRDEDTCSYCKRIGHHYDNCRRRLKQCLRCGSLEHFRSACTQRKTSKTNEQLN